MDVVKIDHLLLDRDKVLIANSIGKERGIKAI
jgi:hypothetical protein